MNEIWANRLIAGTRTWDELPDSRKTAVKKVLIIRVENEEITEEQYKQITGEVYTV